MGASAPGEILLSLLGFFTYSMERNWASSGVKVDIIVRWGVWLGRHIR